MKRLWPSSTIALIGIRRISASGRAKRMYWLSWADGKKPCRLIAE